MKTIEILREEAEKIKKEMVEKNLTMEDIILRFKKKGTYTMSPKTLRRFQDLFEYDNNETKKFNQDFSELFSKKYLDFIDGFASMSIEEFLYQLEYYFINDVKKITYETFYQIVGKELNKRGTFFSF